MASIIKVNDIQNTSGANIINESSNTITIGASGDNIIIPSGATITNNGTATGFGNNTPSFFAYRTTGQLISDNTEVKIVYDVELWDTDSAYDSSTNYRFTVPSGKGGKYYIGAYARITNFTSSRRLIYLKKNGSTNIMQGEFGNDGPYQTLSASTIADLSAGDYIELWGYQNSGSSQYLASGNLSQTGFFGFKLIGV